MWTSVRFLALAAVLGAAVTARTNAAQVQLAWNAPSNNIDGSALTDLAGYNLYRGASSGSYTAATNVGNATAATATGLAEGQTYYFAIRAYNAARIESDYSAEISVAVPDVTPPAIVAPAPATITADATEKAAVPDFLTTLTVSDNCTPRAGLALSQVPAAGSLVAVGTTTVTITARDAAGNQSQVAVALVVLSANKAPVVNAGPDLTIFANQSASLSGSVADDGLPAGTTVAVAWTRVSGPGTVTFANATAPVTTATFGAAGSYVLRLSANDGALSASDDAIVTVQPALTSQPINVRVRK